MTLGSGVGVGVRKHQAPKGALRPAIRGEEVVDVAARQKAPSAKSCIKTCSSDSFTTVHNGQKAPSAERCIKTWRVSGHMIQCQQVRKHRAPKGALRQVGVFDVLPNLVCVRKHRAPKGALRQGVPRAPMDGSSRSQKAPSAKRCIKTSQGSRTHSEPDYRSESTERQTVH